MKARPIFRNMSVANITPQIFSGNIRRLLAEPSPFDNSICAADAISQKLIKIACDPDKENLYAVEMVMDRVDGRPAQKVTVEQAIEVLLGIDDTSLAEVLGIPINALQQQRRLTGVKELDDKSA